MSRPFGAFARIPNLLASPLGLMRRLFSTFARGLPGTGLLIMRLVAGTVLVARAIVILGGGPKLGPAILQVLAIVAGLLLLAGLWTPIAGALAAVIYSCH